MNKAADEIDLREVIARLWAGKWWIVASTFVLTAAFIIAAFVMTPIFRATVVLVPAGGEATEQGRLGGVLRSASGLASLMGVNLMSGESGEQEALAVLRSREFLEVFFAENNLLPVLFYKDWDSARSRWKKPDDAPTPARAHKLFTEDVLLVNKDTETGLVTVSIDWRDRELAAVWANELISRLNNEMRSRALRDSTNSLSYLRRELEANSLLAIQQAINSLIEAQVNKQMLANVSEEYAFRVVDRAMAPDPDDEIRPNKPLLAVLGFLLGGFLGICGVLIASDLRRAN
jgi:uncharacterized protein involved in exopolysaccharide biosynthesis